MKREQEEAVSHLLGGKDFLAVLPTGFEYWCPSSNKTFGRKFVSVRVDTVDRVDRSGSERLKISGRLAGGRLQFSQEITPFVSLNCFEVDGEL